jgi:nitronate monooxygenase
VIAAGGIGDARGVAAVLALGAQAAWVGTRFLLADEAPVHQTYRDRLIAAVETDAKWYADLYEVGWPDAPHRAAKLNRRDLGALRAARPRRSSGRGRRRGP